MTRVISNHVSVHLERVLVLVQNRCTICAKHTIGLEIILGARDGILGDVGHVESHFGPFGDSVSVGGR